eukprot:g430.t1
MDGDHLDLYSEDVLDSFFDPNPLDGGLQRNEQLESPTKLRRVVSPLRGGAWDFTAHRMRSTPKLTPQTAKKFAAEIVHQHQESERRKNKFISVLHFEVADDEKEGPTQNDIFKDGDGAMLMGSPAGFDFFGDQYNAPPAPPASSPTDLPPGHASSVERSQGRVPTKPNNRGSRLDHPQRSNSHQHNNHHILHQQQSVQRQQYADRTSSFPISYQDEDIYTESEEMKNILSKKPSAEESNVVGHGVMTPASELAMSYANFSLKDSAAVFKSLIDIPSPPKRKRDRESIGNTIRSWNEAKPSASTAAKDLSLSSSISSSPLLNNSQRSSKKTSSSNGKTSSKGKCKPKRAPKGNKAVSPPKKLKPSNFTKTKATAKSKQKIEINVRQQSAFSQTHRKRRLRLERIEDEARATDRCSSPFRIIKAVPCDDSEFTLEQVNSRLRRSAENGIWKKNNTGETTPGRAGDSKLVKKTIDTTSHHRTRQPRPSPVMFSPVVGEKKSFKNRKGPSPPASPIVMSGVSKAKKIATPPSRTYNLKLREGHKLLTKDAGEIIVRRLNPKTRSQKERAKMLALASGSL